MSDIKIFIWDYHRNQEGLESFDLIHMPNREVVAVIFQYDLDEPLDRGENAQLEVNIKNNGHEDWQLIGIFTLAQSKKIALEYMKHWGQN